MKKNTTKANLHEIKKITSKLPKTINEALDFEGTLGEENEELFYDDSEMDMEEEAPIREEPAGMDVAAFIDDIRKKALKGMAQLADNPLDTNYTNLKRIWQICDRAATEGQEQQQQQQQRPM